VGHAAVGASVPAGGRGQAREDVFVRDDRQRVACVFEPFFASSALPPV
jgi:hypothetical protein